MSNQATIPHTVIAYKVDALPDEPFVAVQFKSLPPGQLDQGLAVQNQWLGLPVEFAQELAQNILAAVEAVKTRSNHQAPSGLH